MSTPTRSFLASSAGDDRLEEAVLAYVKAADAGQPLDPEEWLARYPDLADELRAFLEDQRLAPSLLSIAARRAVRGTGRRVTSPATRCWGSWAGAAWASSTRPGRSALNRVVALKMILAGGHAGADGAGPLPHRGRGGRPAAAPQHRAGLRGRRARRPAVLLAWSSVAGGSLAQQAGRHAAARRASAAELVETLARAVHAAHERRHRPPRPEAGQRAAGRRRHAQDHRLRPGQEARRRRGQTADRRRHGHALATWPPSRPAARRKDVGPAADVYALGAILYELLTGRPPFQAATPLETLLQVRDRRAGAAAQLSRGVPRDLETICLKCLQKDPARRYASAADLADDLRRFLRRRADPGPAGRRRPSAGARGLPQRPAVAALAAAVFAAAGGRGGGRRGRLRAHGRGPGPRGRAAAPG